MSMEVHWTSGRLNFASGISHVPRPRSFPPPSPPPSPLTLGGGKMRHRGNEVVEVCVIA